MTNLKFKRIMAIVLTFALIFTCSAPLLAAGATLNENAYTYTALTMNEDVVVYNKGNDIVYVKESYIMEEFLYKEPTFGYEMIEPAGVPILVGLRVWSLSRFLWQTIYVASFATVSGAQWASAGVHFNNNNNRNDRNHFFAATIAGGDVVIDTRQRLTLDQAASRLSRGLNIYTFYRSNAFYVAQRAMGTGGLSVIGPEIDQNMREGRIYYYHFHLTPRRDFPGHAWHGPPHTR